jgi:peptide deformylase
MSEIELSIRRFPDPVLRRKARSVRVASARHRALLSAMARLMYESQGIGLAAPQTGISESMIVVDIGTGLYKLINPRIARRLDSQSMEEGCLSVPGVCIKITRARSVIVEARDEEFNPVTVEAEGLLACVFQHEIDHLHGTLIVDHASLLDRIRFKHRLKTLKEKNEQLSKPGTRTCQLQL